MSSPPLRRFLLFSCCLLALPARGNNRCPRDRRAGGYFGNLDPRRFAPPEGNRYPRDSRALAIWTDGDRKSDQILCQCTLGSAGTAGHSMTVRTSLPRVTTRWLYTVDRHARVASPHCRGMGRGRLLSRELGSACCPEEPLTLEIHSPLDLTQVWCGAARWQGRGRLTSSIMQVMPTAALPQDIMLAVLFSIRIDCSLLHIAQQHTVPGLF